MAVIVDNVVYFVMLLGVASPVLVTFIDIEREVWRHLWITD